MVEKIREIAAENLNLDLKAVTATAKFKEDLEIDSLVGYGAGGGIWY